MRPARPRGEALAARVKREHGVASAQAKKWIASGKISVDGRVVLDAGHRAPEGARVELHMRAPRPRERSKEVQIVYQDRHLVVIDKPSGMSSVPYEPGDRETALDAVRSAWRRRGEPATEHALHVVHRIDKDTSGLLLFALTKTAERHLARQFRDHSLERCYLCVVHGETAGGRIESRLIRDRGDGLRGSSRDARGKRAVTHVRSLKKLSGATLCEVRLETGRTHQIRIHLAEAGHPLVGDRVYTRDRLLSGRELLDSPRLLLHAQTLGFTHPDTERRLIFEAPLPADFGAALESLRLRSA